MLTPEKDQIVFNESDFNESAEIAEEIILSKVEDVASATSDNENYTEEGGGNMEDWEPILTDDPTGMVTEQATVACCVTGIQITPSTLTMAANDTCLLAPAIISPSNASNKNVTWHSSDETVATVSSGRLICPIKVGTTVITAIATDGSGVVSNKCTVTVTEPLDIKVTGIQINPSCKSMKVGDTCLLASATVSPSNASNKNVTWHSSDESVATVSSGRLICPKNGGETIITARATDGSGVVSNECTVVVAVPVTSVVITNAPTYIKTNRFYSFTACVYPTNASNQAIYWSSSNENVATINMTSGILKTIAAGDTIITARSIDGGKIAACFVTIYNEDAPPPQPPTLDRPLYPTGVEDEPRDRLDSPYDPLGFLELENYKWINLKPVTTWYIPVSSNTNAFRITNTHAFYDPVSTGQTVDEKWYYISTNKDVNKMHIASHNISYRAIAYCEVEVYDDNFNFLGNAGNEIGIRGGDKYYIRTYGIGTYHLYVNLSSYILENNHFIVDSSLHGYLVPSIITTAKFNLYMKRLDLAYEAMLDLVGKAPCNGSKITIQKGDVEIGVQYVRISQPYINYNPAMILDILNTLEADPNDWWLSGSTHELGHLFDEDAHDKWLYTSEGFGTYKAWLAIEKCGGNVCYSDKHKACFHEKPLAYNWDKNLEAHMSHHYTPNDMYNYRKIIGGYDYAYGDDIVYLLNPVINELGWDQFWSILKKVFRSYDDNSYTPGSYTGSQEHKNAADLLDRCSHFITQCTGETTDIKDYWMKETRELYEINMKAND